MDYMWVLCLFCTRLMCCLARTCCLYESRSGAVVPHTCIAPVALRPVQYCTCCCRCCLLKDLSLGCWLCTDDKKLPRRQQKVEQHMINCNVQQLPGDACIAGMFIGNLNTWGQAKLTWQL